MLNLSQCLGANRPLIFTVCESDVEVLKHLNDNFKRNQFFVYSTTFTDIIPLETVLNSHFKAQAKTKTTVGVLSEILAKTPDPNEDVWHTYVFLDCESYIHDAQHIRKIKDIVSRYQLDVGFVVNMIFVSQSVCVPNELERLSEVVFFDLPSEDSLKELSDRVTTQLELKEDAKPTDEVVNNLKGLTLFEAEQAYLQSFQIHKKIDLSFIQDFKKSSVAKTNLLTLLESDTTFSDIGGMDNLKRWIKKSYGGWTLEGKKFGLPLLRGLLLIGLPGCGKTAIAKSLGNEWKLPVIQFDPSRVFSSRVGDSEANIQRVLKIVENVSPVVLFIDEIEKSFSGYQSSAISDSGVTSRVISSFLIWMQDTKAPVFVVATCNGLQYMLPELIQRFDERFFVNLPQADERKDIFGIHLKKFNRDPKIFDLDKLSKNSEDLSGREIEQTLKESLYDCFYSKKELTTESILRVLDKKISLLKTMGEQLSYMIKWVDYDEEKGDGVRARFASTPNSMDMSRIKNEIDTLLKDIEGGKSKK